jgi:hypothetical protein
VPLCTPGHDGNRQPAYRVPFVVAANNSDSAARDAARLAPGNNQPLHVEDRLPFNGHLRLAVMSPLSEDKLLSLLVEIQSDIRQIKSDLQALLTQQQKPPPVTPSDGDYILEPSEPANSGRSASPAEVLRYLRETRGEDDTGD